MKFSSFWKILEMQGALEMGWKFVFLHCPFSNLCWTAVLWLLTSIVNDKWYPLSFIHSYSHIPPFNLADFSRVFSSWKHSPPDSSREKKHPAGLFQCHSSQDRPHHQGFRHRLSRSLSKMGTCLGNKMGIKWWLWMGIFMLSWVSVSVPAFSLLGECRSPLLQPLSQMPSYSFPSVAEPSLQGYFLVVQLWQHRE